MNLFSDYWNGFIALFFPEVCIACGKSLVTNEHFICLNCLHDLPRTNFHKTPGNAVEQIFWGRVPVEQATSYFFFRKGSKYQRLVHFLKYKGLKEIGFEIGKHYGFDLKESAGFSTADFIVPVPLHPRKQKIRGYNQSEWLAKGLGFALGIPVESGNLERVVFTATQTRKNRFERWENVEGIFRLKEPIQFENKHILLVDDVITTGSTLEACITAIRKAAGVKTSVATLAFADS